MAQFEYLVCQVQQSRVTFANGDWAGSVAPGGVDPQTALDSCPEVWAYLNHTGAKGWEMIAATTRVQDDDQVVDVLYLRRRR
jgi:hypothetical protein